MGCRRQKRLWFSAHPVVGGARIEALVRSGAFNPIVTLVRKSLPEQVAMAAAAGIELREVLVPTMDATALERATTEALRSLEGDVGGLSVLGDHGAPKLRARWPL